MPISHTQSPCLIPYWQYTDAVIRFIWKGLIVFLFVLSKINSAFLAVSGNFCRQSTAGSWWILLDEDRRDMQRTRIKEKRLRARQHKG